MTPLDVAKYLRAFQKAATTRKVKSRMIRRESRLDDNVAELIRSVLPKGFFRLMRRRRGYELVWTGTRDTAVRLGDRLAAWPEFHNVVTQGAARLNPTLWIDHPTEELLASAVAMLPVLNRFKREEAQRAAGVTEVAEATEEAVEPEEIEEEEVQRRIVVAAEVAPTTAPQNVTAAFAEAARARAEALNTPAAPFRTAGARRFAEMLARANANRGANETEDRHRGDRLHRPA